jgi:radical SAM superfamily enzyme YgiQ (UPF0313 family)
VRDSAGLNVVLVSSYELGRQPFGLASPAAWLRQVGADVTQIDLAVEKLDEEAIRSAALVAFYVPMHTAARIAAETCKRVRVLNPHAHVCFYGLYAAMNEELFRSLGAETILAGEFEEGLLSLYRRLQSGSNGGDGAEAGPQPEELVSLARLQFVAPDRTGLPSLDQYAKVQLPSGEQRVVGYTEATRGCKHLCRHCPIVPVYGGRFRIVQRDVVLEDVAAQVAAGAQHVTFGDPDFFNGPTHAVKIVEELHRRFPDLTYDVTIKVQHLLKNRELLPTLRDTGCMFVTCAVESVENRILEKFDKHHTGEDFIEAVGLFQDIGLTMNPTFVTFNPWTTVEGYSRFLALIAELDLIQNVSPIQYAIRLLIPRGSRILELEDIQELIGPFDHESLCYRWEHPDPAVDRLFEDVLEIVKDATARKANRPSVFADVWRKTHEYLPSAGPQEPPVDEATLVAPATVPFLTEPWYC